MNSLLSLSCLWSPSLSLLPLFFLLFNSLCTFIFMDIRPNWHGGDIISFIILSHQPLYGIGRSVCQLFAREGARIIAVDIQEEANMETLKSLAQGNHCAMTADISNVASVNEIFTKLKERFNAVPTVIVNSAGITRDNILLRATEEDFNEVIAINLKGTYVVTQAAVKMMLSEKVEHGSIVNISSIVGKGGNIGQCNYAASKAGVIGLTKSASKELSRFNIRVNAILPGFISTPMTDAVPEKVLQKMLKFIPMQRFGQPEEVAETCLFLATKRSAYITGACLEVSGGLNI
ncbi:HSD17B8 [Acanthosepion pharaonis]|uniref:(3R)-3-hydroxyacyl-CoA dehydrogenase n=1 Tax=Acanthosepion pharaonis TaxID=158019 RepID=A0A812DDZ9_ACAPH|nr:HSD17B8 [Sepia pharaonis]